MIIMKRQIISWGMMLVAAFTLTNCAKEIENPNQQPEQQGYPFEIVASTVDTKTVNDGMATKWVAEDKINLFHAVCDDTDYKNNGAFTVKDVESGNFAGNLCEELDPQEEYDWYAFYPYKSQIASPKNEAGWAYIGNRNGITQAGGYGKTAHLASSNCPLYGVAKAVPAADTPSIEMWHLSSVVAINVINMTDEPLTVTSATLTANEPIVGSFYIDFSSTPTYTASEEQYVSNAATVNVTGGAALGNGESGVLYLVVKPFTAAKDSKLYLSVNGYEKELTMPQDVTFTAGKIKTLNFKYDKAPTPHVTWDLTQDSYSSAAADKVTWTSDYVNLSLEQGESSSSANNYLGGANAHTRVYKGHVMTFAPVGKYQIESIEFNVVESSYVDELTGSEWTNANVSSSGTTVTVIPDDGHSDVSVTIGAATRFTAISIYYSLDEDYVLPTVESIVVSGQTTEFIQNATFSFDGKVTAIYTNDKEVDVTESVTVSTPDLTTAGTKEVTVTYMDGETPVTATYEITVVEASAVSGWILTSFADLKAGDQVVIVGTKSSKQYAMSNDMGTSKPPIPVEVTVSGNKLSNDPVTNVIWYVGEDGDNRIFYATAAKTTWLYCTATNNGVRVGDNTNKTFAWSNDYLQHVGTSRYLGIYNTQDWRCYTSHTVTNIANQTFQFYVKAGEGGGETPVEKTLESIAVSDAKTEYTVGDEFVEPTVTATYSDGSTEDVTASAEFTGYNMSAADTYTVTVSYSGKTTTYSITVSPAQGGGEEGGDSVEQTATFNFKQIYIDNNNTTTSNVTVGDITFVGEKGTGSTPARAWSDGLRLYAGCEVTFKAADGYVITSISGDTALAFTGSQQTVEFSGLSKKTISANIVVTYKLQ